jgi:Fe-S oxidoreductase
MPAWSRRPLVRAIDERARPRQARGEAAPVVHLFADTFTNYSHPEIGVAAFDVLTEAGVHARVASPGCCARPLISQGLLGEATRTLKSTIDALYPIAQRGEAIVFLEPSCLSSVREDAPDLLRGSARERARTVAARCVLFEELLERELASGRIRLAVARGPSTVLLHGHCHQKAMGLAAPARALLARIPGASVVDLDAGCCGMAGSFGYVKEHYEVSQQIGERKLLPAARAMQPGTTLVASGTSCREQVKHFTGVRALHAAELIASLLPRT